MPNTTAITIIATGKKQRLDLFLAKKLTVTRSQVQKMITDGQIKVNGKVPKKAGDKVKEGDAIIVHTSQKKNNGTTEQRNNKKELADKRYGDTEIVVIKETPDHVVIEKPSGLLVHPTMAREPNTLTNWLTKKYPEIKKVGDDPNVRPGIVHRLDREASGLLVVARTQKMFVALKEQFKNRTITKEYFALVHGKVAKDWDEINFPIARSETSERMAAIPLTKGGVATEIGKEAKTEFLVEKRFVNFTLLRIGLHTGRLHQIRVHLLAYNHPLVGDPLYVQKKRKRAWDEKLGRLFLHATKLSFTNLDGGRQTFESPLPNELTEFLKKIQ